LVVSVGADDTPATECKTTRGQGGDNSEYVNFSTHCYLLRRRDFSCYNCCRADDEQPLVLTLICSGGL